MWNYTVMKRFNKTPSNMWLPHLHMYCNGQLSALEPVFVFKGLFGLDLHHGINTSCVMCVYLGFFFFKSSMHVLCFGAYVLGQIHSQRIHTILLYTVLRPAKCSANNLALLSHSVWQSCWKIVSCFAPSVCPYHFPCSSNYACVLRQH